MAINWGAARNGQNDLFQYFQMGQQIGQGIVDQKVNKALGRVLTGQGGKPQPAPMGVPVGIPGTMPSGGAALPTGMGGGLVATPEQEAETARLQQMYPNAPQYAQDARTNALDADLATIARYRPELIPQIQDRQQKQAAQQQEAEQRRLMGDALTNPDPVIRSQARRKVAYFNSDMYLKLGEADQKKVDEMMGVIAQQAYPILQLPREQHAQGLQALLSNMKQRGYAVENFKLTGDATADLKIALAMAGQLDDFEKFNQPSFQVLPQGAKLVNTRDPAALASVGQSGTGGGVARPQSKADYDQLPAGSQYYDPEGVLRTKPGGPTPAASGGFPGQ